MTVSLYTSASGLFDDQPKTWIASYAVNSGDLLTGQDDKVLSIPASIINTANGDPFLPYSGNYSDMFLLAEIDTTVGTTLDTQWVRLQVRRVRHQRRRAPRPRRQLAR